MQWKQIVAALAVIGLALAVLVIMGGPAQAQLAPAPRAAPPAAPAQAGNQPAQPAPAVPFNLTINGDFETGNLSPWTTNVNGGSGAIVATPVHAGNFAARVTTAAIAAASSGIGGGGNCA